MKQEVSNAKEQIMFERATMPLDKMFSIGRRSAQSVSSSRYYHFHDFYEIYYLYQGERYYFIKDKTYHVKSGNLVLVKPYDIHCTVTYTKQSFDRHLVEFSKEYISEILCLPEGADLLKCFSGDVYIIKLNMQQQHYIETMLQSMQNEYNDKNEGYDLYLKTALAQLLVFVNRNCDKQSQADTGYINQAHKTISEITAYINNNYQTDITLATISKKFYISPYHLSRTFKANTGFSFVEYLNGVRIKEAQNLIRKTDKTIADIAQYVGYNSVTHFGRVFKNITGISPVNYKKLHYQNKDKKD